MAAETDEGRVLRLLIESRQAIDEELFMTGGCDHSVGICYCALRTLCDELELEILHQYGFEPRVYECSRCHQRTIRWYAQDDICEPCWAVIEEADQGSHYALDDRNSAISHATEADE